MSEVDKKDFFGILGEYKWVKTEDKSWTLWSEKFDENCHSLAGAKDETHYNFLEGCEIKELDANLDRVHILEVGFGLGIGLKETFEFWKKHLQKPIVFVSLELDRKLVENSIEQMCLKDLTVEWEETPLPHYSFHHCAQKFQAMILIGDARSTLPLAKKSSFLPDGFHAIYQDPFSPKRCPELWSLQWFELLREVSHNSVRLSTYSASYSVRKALLEAGWFMENRKGFKHKKSSTRAFLDPHRADENLMNEIRKAKIRPMSD